LHAGENFHQRALTGAILANYGQHFSLVELQLHLVQRAHAGKALTDAMHGQQGH